jgi:hypothetical protein
MAAVIPTTEALLRGLASELATVIDLRWSGKRCAPASDLGTYWTQPLAPEALLQGLTCWRARRRSGSCWVMSSPRGVSSVPTGCIRAGQSRLLAAASSALSQSTRLVAQRLVTATVTNTLPTPGGHLPATNGRTNSSRRYRWRMMRGCVGLT